MGNRTGEAARRLTGTAGRRRTTRLTGLAFVAPSILIVGAFFVLPIGLTIYMSFFDWPLFGSAEFSGAANYERIGQDRVLFRALGFTAVFAGLSTALTVVTGLGLAIAVSGSRRGTPIIRTAVFLPVVVGMASACFLWIWLLNPDVGPVPHLLSAVGLAREPPALLATSSGALTSIVVMTLWKSAGFAMVIFLIGLQSIPVDVFEAAAVDGAVGWRRFRWITLPLLRPTTALVVVLQLTQNLLAFDQFFLMTKGGPGNSTITAVYWVYSKAFANFELGYGAALALVLLVLLVVINALQLGVIRRDPGGAS